VLAVIRALWTGVEQAPGAEQDALRQEIAQAIQRLRTNVERALGQPVAAEAPDLFAAGNGQAPEAPPAAPPPRFREPVLRIYDKDLTDHAFQHLPQAAEFSSVDAFRDHLAAQLRFNSASTRARIASRITSRFFPNDVLHPDLVQFAAAARGRPALADVLFYLTCRTEQIVALVAEQVVYPALAEGGVARTRILDFVRGHFPESRSVPEVAAAIVRTYEGFGVGRPNRTRLLVSQRPGNLEAFAYLLHLEFPEPGMHPFEPLLQGPLHQWLLWDPEWMTEQLYRLRDVGLLARVSEIDRVRQFTTRFPLQEALGPIVALIQEPRRETLRA
jgi:DNA repair protein RadC